MLSQISCGSTVLPASNFARVVSRQKIKSWEICWEIGCIIEHRYFSKKSTEPVLTMLWQFQRFNLRFNMRFKLKIQLEIQLEKAIFPHRFVKYARGHLMVHEWAGFTSFVLDPKGPHRIGVSVDRDGFLDFLKEKLLLNNIADEDPKDGESKDGDVEAPSDEVKTLKEIKPETVVEVEEKDQSENVRSDD
eukprot:TRINITY_DN3451_c0_g1_i7.p2 TRINITY_DN3451_c0_g1~~TRINITY_DN3451_c0_g1_i7.p2  ORF type:complete len:190 (-),score=69.79 TRINITY_DN3451_c0_g1_i7:216-785(-)